MRLSLFITKNCVEATKQLHKHSRQESTNPQQRKPTRTIMKDDRGLKRSMQCSNLLSLGLSAVQDFNCIQVLEGDFLNKETDYLSCISNASSSKRFRLDPSLFSATPATAALEAALSITDGIDDADDSSVDIQEMSMLLLSAESSCASSFTSQTSDEKSSSSSSFSLQASVSSFCHYCK